MARKRTQIDPRDLYFEINDGKSVLPASLTKRFLARSLDFLSYVVIGWILVMIGSSQLNDVINISDGLPDIASGNTYYTAFYATTDISYLSLFMVGMVAMIVSAIFFGFIYPIFINKKYPGQTLGKKLLGIAPIYLNEKYNPKMDTLKRELPITFMFIFVNSLLLVVGFNPTSMAGIYNIFASNQSTDYEQVGSWNFLTSSVEYGGIEKYQQVFGSMNIIFSSMFLIILLVLTFSIAFGRKKRGMHDNFANTAIVDLSTMGEFKNLEQPNENDISPEIDKNQFAISKLTIENFGFKKEVEEFDLSDLYDSSIENLGETPKNNDPILELQEDKIKEIKLNV